MHMQIAGTYFAYLMSNSSPGTYTPPYTKTTLNYTLNEAVLYR